MPIIKPVIEDMDYSLDLWSRIGEIAEPEPVRNITEEPMSDDEKREWGEVLKLITLTEPLMLSMRIDMNKTPPPARLLKPFVFRFPTSTIQYDNFKELAAAWDVAVNSVKSVFRERTGQDLYGAGLSGLIPVLVTVITTLCVGGLVVYEYYSNEREKPDVAKIAEAAKNTGVSYDEMIKNHKEILAATATVAKAQNVTLPTAVAKASSALTYGFVLAGAYLIYKVFKG